MFVCVCCINCLLPLAQDTIGLKYSLTNEETLHAVRHMWREMSVCVTGMLMCRALTTILWPGFKEVLVWEVVFVLCGPEMDWGIREGGKRQGRRFRMWMGSVWCVRWFYLQSERVSFGSQEHTNLTLSQFLNYGESHEPCQYNIQAIFYPSFFLSFWMNEWMTEWRKRDPAMILWEIWKIGYVWTIKWKCF